MINVSSIKQYLLRNTTKIAIALALVVICGGVALTWGNAQQRDKNRELVLSQLRTSQAKVAAEADAAHAQMKIHSDVSGVEFKDVSTRDFQKPTCSRLENRPAIIIANAGCAYSLRATGRATMGVVFVYEGTYSAPEYNQLASDDANNVNSLAYINTYLHVQAKRFKVADPPTIDMKYFGPYPVSESVINTYYRNNGTKLINIYQKTSENNKVPEQDFDMVHYVLLNQTYGGIAFPSLHRAFSYNTFTVPTFTHETLHLYGASDKYNNNDCNTVGTNDPFGRYQGTLPGTDIMCTNFSLDSSMINDITAREIGWVN